MTGHKDYFNHLSKRSRLGLIYRINILYPKLIKYLDGRVLDIGCGLGDFLEFRPQTVGIDINPLLIEYCKKKNLDVYQMEYDKIPFEDNTFDSILLDNVLEHINNPKMLLIEIYRSLMSKGKLLIGVPGKKGFKRDSDHKKFYDKNSLINLVEGFGYKYKTHFYTPINMNLFSNMISQHCLYCQFERKN